MSENVVRFSQGRWTLEMVYLLASLYLMRQWKGFEVCFGHVNHWLFFSSHLLTKWTLWNALSQKVDGFPPVYPARLPVAYVESTGPTAISIVFAGNLLPFREGFNAAQVPTKKRDVEDSQYAEWFRVLHSIDLSVKEELQRILDIFRDKVLYDSPCMVRIRSECKDVEVWNSFMNAVKTCPGVRVVSLEPPTA